MIENRLNDNSSNKEIFEESKKGYEEALKESGYNNKLTYNQERKKRNHTNESGEKKKKKNRRRKVYWFNPPYNDSVENNIGNQFLKIVDKHFGKERKDKLHKVLNRKTVKISYSCTQNFGNMIKNHNKKIEMKENMNENENETNTCNCRKKEECPLQGECIQETVVYRAKVKVENGIEMTYIGSTEGQFKKRQYQHKSDFKYEKNKNKTTLAHYVWTMKEKGKEPNVTWEIVKKCNKYRCGSKKCDLCLTEKLEILKGRKNGERMLNKRSELMNKCRHKRKFILEP